MQENNNFQVLQDSLQQLLGQQMPLSQAGNAPMPQGMMQNQPGGGPEQLFANLLQGAYQNQGKTYSQRNFNVPKISSISPLETHNMHGIESQATAQAIQNGADPQMLGQASSALGKNAYIGLCEAFVERMTQGKEGIFPSAIAAWNNQSHQQGLSGIQPGDTVYFNADASNGYNGHTGIYEGNGNFLSATNNGIKVYNMDDWQKSTGQKLLGYVSQNSKSAPPMRQQAPAQPPGPQLKPMQQPYQPGQRLNQAPQQKPQLPLQQVQPKPPQQQQQPFLSQQPKPPTSVPKSPPHVVQGNPLQSLLHMFG